MLIRLVSWVKRTRILTKEETINIMHNAWSDQTSTSRGRIVRNVSAGFLGTFVLGPICQFVQVMQQYRDILLLRTLPYLEFSF